MIRLTLNKTSALRTFIDHERDDDNNIVLTSETWSDMVDKVNELDILGQGGTTKEALDTMISRYESLYDVKLLLPGDDSTVEDKAKAFFSALSFRETVKIGGSR